MTRRSRSKPAGRRFRHPRPTGRRMGPLRTNSARGCPQRGAVPRRLWGRGWRLVRFRRPRWTDAEQIRAYRRAERPARAHCRNNLRAEVRADCAEVPGQVRNGGQIEPAEASGRQEIIRQEKSPLSQCCTRKLLSTATDNQG